MHALIRRVFCSRSSAQAGKYPKSPWIIRKGRGNYHGLLYTVLRVNLLWREIRNVLDPRPPGDRLFSGEWDG
jgi:hypothetical protein